MHEIIKLAKSNYTFKASLLIFITIISYAFLLNNINLWSDELYSVLMAKDSFSDMWELLTTEDSKPPLYYLYLKFILFLFPKKYEIFGAHFASFLLLVLAQIFAFVSVKKDYGDKVALWLIAFIMLLPHSLWLALEVRTYMLSSLLLLMAFVYGLRLTRTPTTSDFYKFGIASILALYSHYYCAIFLMFLYLFILIILIKDKTFNKYGYSFLVTTSIVAICFLPWVFIPLSNGGNISKYWYVNMDFVKFSWRFFTNPLQPEIFQSYFFIATVFSVVTFNFIIVTGVFDFKCFSHKLQRAILIGVFSFIATYVLLLVISYMLRPIVTARYLKIFSLILYFVGAIVVSQIKILQKPVIFSLVIGFIFTYADIRAISFDNEYKRAVSDIRKFISKDTTILATDNANLFCEYYLPEYKCAIITDEHGEILRLKNLKKYLYLYNKEPTEDMFVLSIYNTVSNDCIEYKSTYRFGQSVSLCKINKDLAKHFLLQSLNKRLNK